MAGYGWTAYDAREGGVQVVNDTGNNLDLINYFAKISDHERHGNWGLRIKGILRSNAHDRQTTAVIFYLGSEDSTLRIECRNADRTGLSSSSIICEGTTNGLGNFKLEIFDLQPISNRFPKTSVKSLTVPTDTIWKAKSIFANELKGSDSQGGMIGDDAGRGNLHFVKKNSWGSSNLTFYSPQNWQSRL